ncbi:PspC domain-containing protein [Actinomadura algeriensis]|uniref:Phage shock protein PspC (Stress-responsive transcriptional regulator) n=1 Tax=Actinomadura algeriensis TaxID=1679523 RepID=A0ABR9JR28_9ACTN|nr:PspC domain-containing protein [Actinomadura algeriensis]MBE1533017.1 phage shock protein PspC (stress-responsive transcriptional regulator) [Actinomadura algeriensis]
MDMEKTTSRSLRRTHDGRLVAGVCSGVARFAGVDANIVRLALAVFTLFGGAGIALYVIGWLLMPDEGAPKSIAEDLAKKAGDSPAFQDAVQKAKDAVGSKKKTSV